MNISKNQIKWVKSLTDSKTRNELGLYVVEGIKSAAEWLASGQEIQSVFAVQEWFDMNSEHCNTIPAGSRFVVLPHELERISNLKTPNQVLLVVKKPKPGGTVQNNKWYLCVEQIQDPGNLGTIIRIADWFGIEKIFISKDSVDPYNSKVVQATMGSMLRVEVLLVDLPDFFKDHIDVPIYAAVLQGENIAKLNGVSPGFILLGNESRGLSFELMGMSHQLISIGKFGDAESLNVAVAAGIICHVFINGENHA